MKGMTEAFLLILGTMLSAIGFTQIIILHRYTYTGSQLSNHEFSYLLYHCIGVFMVIAGISVISLSYALVRREKRLFKKKAPSNTHIYNIENLDCKYLVRRLFEKDQ